MSGSQMFYYRSNFNKRRNNNQKHNLKLKAMFEIWVDICVFEGLYQVSNFGIRLNAIAE